MVKTRFFGVILILAIFLSACGQQNATAIIGKWKNPTNTGSVEFADNSVYRVVTPDGESFEGTYSFTDGDTVQISVPQEFGGTYSVDVKVSGDTLTFIAPDGSSASLSKIK